MVAVTLFLLEYVSLSDSRCCSNCEVSARSTAMTTYTDFSSISILLQQPVNNTQIVSRRIEPYCNRLYILSQSLFSNEINNCQWKCNQKKQTYTKPTYKVSQHKYIINSFWINSYDID